MPRVFCALLFVVSILSGPVFSQVTSEIFDREIQKAKDLIEETNAAIIKMRPANQTVLNLIYACSKDKAVEIYRYNYRSLSEELSRALAHRVALEDYIEAMTILNGELVKALAKKARWEERAKTLEAGIEDMSEQQRKLLAEIKELQANAPGIAIEGNYQSVEASRPKVTYMDVTNIYVEDKRRGQSMLGSFADGVSDLWNGISAEERADNIEKIDGLLSQVYELSFEISSFDSQRSTVDEHLEATEEDIQAVETGFGYQKSPGAFQFDPSKFEALLLGATTRIQEDCGEPSDKPMSEEEFSAAWGAYIEKLAKENSAAGEREEIEAFVGGNEVAPDDRPYIDPDGFEDDIPESTVFPDLPKPEDFTGEGGFTVDALEKDCDDNKDCPPPDPDSLNQLNSVVAGASDQLNILEYNELLEAIGEVTLPTSSKATETSEELDFAAANAKFVTDPAIFANGRRAFTSTCGYESKHVCTKLGRKNSDLCIQAVNNWLDVCQSHYLVHGSNSVASCQSECRMYRVKVESENTLKTMIEAIVSGTGDAASKRAETLAKIEELQSEAQTLDEAVAARILHIYENTETGELIQHAGAYFDPTSPLAYRGEAARGPSEAQLEQMHIIHSDIRKLSEEAESLKGKNGDAAQFESFARSLWFGDSGRAGLFTCTNTEASAAEQACLAKCAGARGSGEICDPFVSAIDFLTQPMSRVYLYPPDHPMREFGYAGR